MTTEEIKKELHELYPNINGFIDHTLVAEMCLKWHELQLKKCNMPVVVGCASCNNESNFSESGKQEICIEGEYRYVTATICNSCGNAIDIGFFD